MGGVVFFFKQKTAYEIYQCDWSSDVCSSDLISWADNYYKAGAIDKGNGVVKGIAERYEEDLAYYYDLDDKMRDYYKDDIQEAMAVFQRLKQITDHYHQKALSDTLDKQLYDNFTKFNMK